MAVVAVWFEPQKLFIDEKVSEALPVAAPTETAPDTTVGAPEDEGSEAEAMPEIRTLGAGEFTPLAHQARGTALFLENADGDRFLRFENFEVENGPDLKVYLSAAPPGSEDPVLVEDFVDLGTLKGNIGSQNYAIADDVDLERYGTAVVWCRRFSVGFAVAGIQLD